MANASILAAFERMWQHVVAALGNKADVSDVTDLQNQMDSKANVEHGHEISEITDLETELNNKANTEHKHESFDELPEGIAKLSDFNMIDTVSGNLVVLENCVPTTPRQLSIYGKSTQNTTTGAQLLNSAEGTFTNYGVTTTVNDNQIVCTGTSTQAGGIFLMGNGFTGTNVVLSLKAGNYTLQGLPKNTLLILYKADGYTSNLTFTKNGTATLANDTDFTSVSLRYESGAVMDGKSYKIMLNAGNTALPWEPYTGGKASPNPENPQEIAVAGESGNIITTVIGKNLAKDYNNRSYAQNGITFTKNSDGSITADGTCTGGVATYLFMANGYSVGVTSLKAGRYIISGCPEGGSETTYRMQMWHYDGANSVRDYGNGAEFECGDLDSSFSWNAAIRIEVGITVNNLTFYPMIRLATCEDDTYEPYTEQVLSISTPNGLPSIPVSSGGNYTDADGQQYVADEIRLNADGTGKWVHRVGKLKGTQFSYQSNSSRWVCNAIDVVKDAFETSGYKEVMCNVARFESTSKEGTCRPGELELAHVQIIYAPENTNMSNVKYYYQCEPYETDLSADEVNAFLNLRMNPTTTIMNDVDCFMDVEYYVNNTENEVNQVIIEHITDHNDPHNVIPVIQEQINNLSVELTQAEYDALEAAGETDPETVYYITDADPESGSGSGASSADKVSYDNTESGLEADNLQGAVNELDSRVDTMQNTVDEVNNKVDSNTTEINNIKTSFQDGCSTIAAAITSMGVSTANNASPATMAANVKKITNTDLGSATKAGAASSYTIPKSGKAIIFYTASFYNYAGATHNGNSGSYTVKLGSTTLDSGSKGTPDSKDGFGFNGIWTGDVTKGQVISLTTSGGGWIRATNVYMRIVIL